MAAKLAVLDIEDASHQAGVALHEVLDELGKCAIAERLVKIVSDPGGETFAQQAGIGITGDNNGWCVMMVTGGAYVAAEFQAILVGQHQRCGDQVKVAAFQPGTGFLHRAAGDEFGFRHLFIEDPHDDRTGDFRTVHHQNAIEFSGH